MTNPFLSWEHAPPFAELAAAHIAPAAEQLVAEGEALLARLEAGGRDWAALMAPLQAHEDRLGQFEGTIRLLGAVRSTPEWREAVKAVQPQLIQNRNRIRQSQPVYAALCALRDEQGAALSGAQRRILDATIARAERTGVQLDTPDRERLNEISEELTALRLAFGDNVLDSTRSWSLLLTERASTDGLPRRWRDASAARARAAGHDEADTDAGPWLVTLDYPCVGPLLSHGTDRAVRETVRRAWGQIASEAPNDNAPLLRSILTLRAEMAGLLGYAGYPQQALADRMAGSVEEIEALMEDLRQHARPGALQENDLLTARAAAAGQPTPLEPWDLGFWAEREREARFAFRDEEVRPYFSLDNVLSALFSLCHELFGVEIVPAAAPPQTWHADVRVYDVCEPGSSEPLATVYLDPYARPEDKRSGAWMSPIVNRSGGRRPVCVIACNLPPPTDEAPSLPGPRGARTLFHEFGHALQHMLTEVEEVGAAGIRNVEWDAVELPSMFMENWMDHRPVLQQIARHYETGAPMPEALLDRLLDARRFRAAPAVLTQVSYALQDLAVHSRDSGDPFAVADAIRERISVTPALDSDRWLCSFQHIFAGGYAAGYYSYLWAEVLSADAFAAFEEDGLDDSAVRHRWGRRFRSTVLARGGSEHPLAVFQDFRGRLPSPKALLRHKGLA